MTEQLIVINKGRQLAELAVASMANRYRLQGRPRIDAAGQKGWTKGLDGDAVNAVVNLLHGISACKLKSTLAVDITCCASSIHEDVVSRQ